MKFVSYREVKNMIMIVVFWLAAVYCTMLGILIWFFPKVIIQINDWLTVNTLLQKTRGVLSRIVMGAILLFIAGIFWWTIFSPKNW